MAAVGGGNVPEHLLDVRPAARERRPTALPTIDSPAHQEPLASLMVASKLSSQIFTVAIVASIVG
jgi:hypothetical protein